MTERCLKDFSPYEVGKISAQYHADERFRMCSELMRGIFKNHPEIDGLSTKLPAYDAAGNPILDAYDRPLRTNYEINKHVIFACYLVSRTAYKDLVELGEQKVADNVDSLFQIRRVA